MGLMVSGVGTFLQARGAGGLGAGMICLQGTSFPFYRGLGSRDAGQAARRDAGGHPGDDLWRLLLWRLRPDRPESLPGSVAPGDHATGDGIVITLIGISLIRVGVTDLGGGAKAANFGAPINLALGGLVLVVIIGLNLSRRPWLRLSAVMIGLLVGSLAAWTCGLLKPQPLPDLPLVSVPSPSISASPSTGRLPTVALIYLISTLETTGDLTANCLISRQPVEGPGYLRRLRGGVLGDGVACLLAATFNTFPSTTFAQNNGVIQLTAWPAAMSATG